MEFPMYEEEYFGNTTTSKSTSSAPTKPSAVTTVKATTKPSAVTTVRATSSAPSTLKATTKPSVVTTARATSSVPTTYTSSSISTTYTLVETETPLLSEKPLKMSYIIDLYKFKMLDIIDIYKFEITLLILLLLGTGVYYFMRKRKNMSTQSASISAFGKKLAKMVKI